MFDDYNTLTTKDKITKCKIELYKKEPFFGYIILNMKLTEWDEQKFPEGNATMGVDAKGNLYYAQKFVDSLNKNELIGVLAHETGHVALMHMLRRGMRDALTFNVSNDAIINDLLTRQGFTLPKKGIIPNNKGTFRIGIKDYSTRRTDDTLKSSEELYDELINNNNKQQITVASKEGFDEHIYGDSEKEGEEGEDKNNNMSPTQKTSAEMNMKKVLSEAIAVAKNQGKLSNDIARIVGGILQPTINWKQKLYRYLTDQIKNDYSWTSPNKRSWGVGSYLPKTLSESIRVIVSVDTSGSMSKEDLRECLSEIKGIGESFNNVEIKVIICDSEIHETHELTTNTINDLANMVMKGGGGTSHVPIYDFVREKLSDTKILINLTDGFTTFPIDKDHPFHSLWVITSNGCEESSIPFGEVIKIEKTI